MIHGYHVIFGAYGFWMPNDPRGSWSEFVGAWELRRFGPATKSCERQELTDEASATLVQIKRALEYRAVQFNGRQARSIGSGFAKTIGRSCLTIWRCSILPEHVHLVIARHRFKVEYIAGLLKGGASKQLKADGIHPLSKYRNDKGELPTPWNVKCWRVYLDSEEAIDNAIHYVDQNPVKEGKPRQHWSFETPFRGLDPGWTTYL